MKIESQRGGTLSIWMSDTDLRRWGLCFDTMSARDGATRAAVSRLLGIARQRGILPESERLAVEAIPLEDGCLLLFTPQRRRALYRMPPVRVYALTSADDILQLGTALSPCDLPTASLYGWGEEYRLIVYPGLSARQETDRHLSEFAQSVGEGAAAAAFVEEYGTPITVGNALHRLAQAYAAPAPAPPHRER